MLSPSPIHFTRPGTDATFSSWPAMPVRNICRRPLGSAASLPAMLHLGEEGYEDDVTDTKSEFPGGLFSRELTQNDDFQYMSGYEEQQEADEKQEAEDSGTVLPADAE